MSYVLREVVNPFLVAAGIEAIQARIGVDLGPLCISRVGVPTGSADQQRNFLTVVSPTANLASKMVENVAGPTDILVGDLVKQNANRSRQHLFVDATPPGWDGIYVGTTRPYPVWRYTEMRHATGDGSQLSPFRPSIFHLLAAGLPPPPPRR
jgi:class 3 adenylate cyclase